MCHHCCCACTCTGAGAAASAGSAPASSSAPSSFGFGSAPATGTTAASSAASGAAASTGALTTTGERSQCLPWSWAAFVMEQPSFFLVLRVLTRCFTGSLAEKRANFQAADDQPYSGGLCACCDVTPDTLQALPPLQAHLQQLHPPPLMCPLLSRGGQWRRLCPSGVQSWSGIPRHLSSMQVCACNASSST
jgi:hypothetical protein